MKIKIGPLDYEMEFVDNPSYDDKELFGYIDNESNTIKIKKNMDSSRTRIIVLHEVLHGVLMQCGLNIDDKDDDDYEQLIECLSHGLYSLIQNNPKLIKYIQTKE